MKQIALATGVILMSLSMAVGQENEQILAVCYTEQATGFKRENFDWKKSYIDTERDRYVVKGPDKSGKYNVYHNSEMFTSCIHDNFLSDAIMCGGQLRHFSYDFRKSKFIAVEVFQFLFPNKDSQLAIKIGTCDRL